MQHSLHFLLPDNGKAPAQNQKDYYIYRIYFPLLIPADTLSSIETRSVCPCKSDLPLTSFPHFSFSSIPEGTLGRDGLPLSCGPGN